MAMGQVRDNNPPLRFDCPSAAHRRNYLQGLADFYAAVGDCVPTCMQCLALYSASCIKKVSNIY